MTTSHLTNSAKDAEQVIGYSQSTIETTSQPTKPPKNGGKVAGYNSAKDAERVNAYSHSTKLANGLA
jgi:hypothetical protein